MKIGKVASFRRPVWMLFVSPKMMKIEQMVHEILPHQLGYLLTKGSDTCGFRAKLTSVYSSNDSLIGNPGGKPNGPKGLQGHGSPTHHTWLPGISFLMNFAGQSLLWRKKWRGLFLLSNFTGFRVWFASSSNPHFQSLNLMPSKSGLVGSIPTLIGANPSFLVVKVSLMLLNSQFLLVELRLNGYLRSLHHNFEWLHCMCFELFFL